MDPSVPLVVDNGTGVRMGVVLEIRLLICHTVRQVRLGRIQLSRTWCVDCLLHPLSVLTSLSSIPLHRWSADLARGRTPGKLDGKPHQGYHDRRRSQ